MISIFIVVILLIIVVILVTLAKNINQSVEKIVTVTEKAPQGDLSADVKTTAADEFGIITNQFNSMMKNTLKVSSTIGINRNIRECSEDGSRCQSNRRFA